MIFDREAPRVGGDLFRRSNDTEGSLVSILAIRDWLDGRRLAGSARV